MRVWLVGVLALGCVPKGGLVELPTSAAEPFALESGGVRVRVSLVGALPVRGDRDGDRVVYRGAHPYGDLIQRTLPNGIEDLVAIAQPPAEPRVSYRLWLDSAVGLRLVDGTLELLDSGGAPRLRVDPPWIADRDGQRHAGTIAVEGCAFDVDPSAPWGRPVVAPGAGACTVTVTWPRAIRYPALLDPTWTTTDTMKNNVCGSGRSDHSATLLTCKVGCTPLPSWTGKVLIAFGSASMGGFGSCSGCNLSSAELYDPSTNTFASTGSGELRTLHRAVQLADNRVLAAGGYGAGFNTRAESYNPATGMWSPAGSVSVVRTGAGLAALANGKAIIAGGQFQNSTYDTVELWDPSGKFTLLPSKLGDINKQGVVAETLLDGKHVLIAGGYYGQQSTTSDIYDADTNTITPAAKLPMGASTFSVRLGSGNVLIISLGQSQEWDGNAFTLRPGPLYGPGVLMENGRVLATSGSQSAIYDPFTTSWISLPSPGVWRAGHSLTALLDGRVLAAGGVGMDLISCTTNSAQLFSLSQIGQACGSTAECARGLNCAGGVCTAPPDLAPPADLSGADLLPPAFDGFLPSDDLGFVASHDLGSAHPDLAQPQPADMLQLARHGCDCSTGGAPDPGSLVILLVVARLLRMRPRRARRR